MIRTLLISLLLLTGCGLAAPTTGHKAADGVGQAHFEVRANATDIVDVDVVYPAQADGSPRAGPFPGIVYVQGGSVSTSQYLWQAQALAREGYVVAVPKHPLDLAFFSIENGLAARDLMVAPPQSLLTGLVDKRHLAVAGHSLGSVVSLKLALAGGFSAVIVQAGYADTADDAKLPNLGMPSLFLAGAADCQATLPVVQEGWTKMPSPTALVVLDGATHFQFTQSDEPDISKGCTPTVPLETSHARMTQAMTSFLESALAHGTVGAAALKELEGAQVQTR